MIQNCCDRLLLLDSLQTHEFIRLNRYGEEGYRAIEKMDHGGAFSAHFLLGFTDNMKGPTLPAILVHPSTGTRETISLLDIDERKQIEAVLTALRIPFVCYGVDEIFYHEKSVDSNHLDILRTRGEPYIRPLANEFPQDLEEVIKVLSFVDVQSDLEAELRRPVSPSCRFTRMIRTDPRFVEFMPINVSKMAGLKRILSELGISVQSVIGFGDAENDAKLITGVGVGVAMANAPPEIKRLATHVTQSNDEDGLAYFLENAAFWSAEGTVESA